MTETVNHPAHYNSHPSGVECIDVTRHMGFNLGNAFKYVYRRDEKGDRIENLRKALWYVEDEGMTRATYGWPSQVFPDPRIRRIVLDLCRKIQAHEQDLVWGAVYMLLAFPGNGTKSGADDLAIVAAFLAKRIEAG